MAPAGPVARTRPVRTAGPVPLAVRAPVRDQAGREPYATKPYGPGGGSRARTADA